MTGFQNGSGPPVKPCDRYAKFEPHSKHLWEKKPGFEVQCIGIPPLDEQPPCRFYISPEQPSCGKPSPTVVRIKTRLIDAGVPLCISHRAFYESTAAATRITRRDSIPAEPVLGKAS